jgi:4-hydroxyproline epimerase
LRRSASFLIFNDWFLMRIIDSHTEGEPTRVIIEGGPDLGSGSMAQRRERFAREFDHVRSFCVNEPRGHDAIVGALLCEPVNPECAAGVIFFNNTGVIGMCGHGTIGLAVTLAHLGRIGAGVHRLETPVGEVSFELRSANEVEIQNVPSYRYQKDVSLDVPGLGRVSGDIAWGGNWFFLCSQCPYPLDLKHIGALSTSAQAIANALWAQGFRGEDGGRIDHIEFFGDPVSADAHSRNFVLCPGGAYDRSPCGTGTSAKLACLAADGKLAPGQWWVQESVIGSRFEGQYGLSEQAGSRVIPRIRGRAHVIADARLLSDATDPFAFGIRAT